MSFYRGMLLSLCLILPSALWAGEAEIKEKLLQAIPTLEISEIKKSEVPGMYEVTASGRTLYSTPDASYFIAGEVYTIGTEGLVNVSEAKREQVRAGQLAQIKPNEKIVFPAVGETKARVAIFTDIDCGYCRKLHLEVPRLNELGIEVSYLAYPRAGIGSESYNKIVSAWCAEDKLKAMTDAKMGKDIKRISCSNPVAAQFELGQQMGVTGTPSILLENGGMVPGYVPADRLANILGIM